jgi:hypothetical protein
MRAECAHCANQHISSLMRTLRHGLRRGACHSHADLHLNHTSVPYTSVPRPLETERLHCQTGIVSFSTHPISACPD